MKKRFTLVLSIAMLASVAASAFTVGKLSYDIVDPINRLVQIANYGYFNIMLN